MSQPLSPRAGRSWQVLLVGGASGTGKSTVAAQLGRRHGVNVTQLDDIQVALETATTPQQLPLLHFWRTNWAEFSSFTDAQHIDHFLDVSRRIFAPILTSLVQDRLNGGLPAIIEGDFILPEVAAALAVDPVGGAVQALFLHEDDEARLVANLVDRHGGDATLPAHTSWLKSRWLQHECERVDLPVIAARPWPTAGARAAKALSVRWPVNLDAQR